MKKVIPFKKEIIFNTSIYEINSISLEHNLKNKNNIISGEFIISGDYKENDSVINNEPFIFNIPCDIDIDERYKDDTIKIDIDDFNYEIIDNNTLEVNIMVSIDGFEEINDEPIIDIIDEEINDNLLDEAYEAINNNNSIDFEEIDEDENEEVREIPEETMSIFNNFDEDDDNYVTYHVHIYREEDNLDKIIKLYGVSKEDLEKYNDLNNINIGSKIIVPADERI